MIGPLARDGRISPYLRDPDGVIFEITKPNGEGVTSDYMRESVLEVDLASYKI